MKDLWNDLKASLKELFNNAWISLKEMAKASFQTLKNACISLVTSIFQWLSSIIFWFW